MPAPADFALYQFIRTRGPSAEAVLASSATPYLSIDEIISLSSDPATTKKALTTSLFSSPLAMCSDRGSKELRTNIAATYNASTSRITADNIIAVNATSGANHIVQRSLLKAGDHVINQYPAYGPLIEEARDIGCEISYLRLDPSNNWAIDLDELKSLVRPGETKMLILNNPGNPTGSQIDNATQEAIIKIAKEHDLVVHCDEIFRPLFHTDNHPASLNEHADLSYDRIVTTCSLSKCYGLSGVRVGWITTRCPELYEKFYNYRLYTVSALSFFDELVATEVMSPRCRPGILNKHLTMAKRNIDIFQRLVDDFPDQVEWVRPVAGAVAFVKFKDPHTGKPVDDVGFCDRLMERKKLLISPGTLCFEFAQNDEGKNEFQGRTRIHFTTHTNVVELGVKKLAEFLQGERQKNGTVNGVNSMNGVDLAERVK